MTTFIPGSEQLVYQRVSYLRDVLDLIKHGSDMECWEANEEQDNLIASINARIEELLASI